MIKGIVCAIFGHLFGFWYFDGKSPDEVWIETGSCQRCGAQKLPTE